MSDQPKQSETVTPSRKPGLLTEDRNTVTRTSDNGEQRLVKVPSRVVEAERQGVDESSI